MKKIIILIGLLLAISLNSYAQNAKKYTTYIVKEGETLKKIAKKVGCRTKEIKNLNPDVAKRPKANTTLVVPNKDYGKKPKKKKDKKKKIAKVIVHKVKQGDTFYGIAKEYNVTIQSIKDANPQLTDGLKPNQKIRIPFKDEFTVKHKKYKVVFYKVKQSETKWSIAKRHNISVAELDRINPNHEGELKVAENIVVPAPKEVEETETNTPEYADMFIYHRVLQGEGLFRIAVMYETTQDKIIELNPEATKHLRPGMLLKIPAKKKDNFLVHTVVKGDTFFSLTRAYEVTKESLLKLNPTLSEGLKVGMLINIKEIGKATTSKIHLGYLKDSIASYKPIHISFLMPLMLSENDAALSRANKQLQDIATDFYMGAEIALDSLKKQGINITHHIYDTKNNATALYGISKEEAFKQSDVAIGPFFFDKTQTLADQVPDIALFTPIFFKKQRLDTHANIVKAAVDKGKKLQKLAQYLGANYNKQKIIIISDENAKSKTKAIEIGSLLKANDSIFSVSYIYPSHNKKDETKVYMEKKKLEESVSEKKETWVILISDNAVINSDVVNTYGVISKHKKVRLFTHKNFKDFDYLDFNLLASLRWSFPTDQLDILDTVENKLFVTKFKNKNHIHPNSYAYSGFDLTYDALMRLAVKGTLEEGLNAGVSNRLAHQYNYKKSAQGDYKNEGMMLIMFTENMQFKLEE